MSAQQRLSSIVSPSDAPATAGNERRNPVIPTPLTTSALIAAMLLTAGAASASDAQLTYPQTPQVDAEEIYFGETIADPYRWLEADIRLDADVAAWVDQQNAVSAAYLAQLPSRDVFAERLTSLFDHDTFTVPIKRGGNYFFTRNSGLENQAVLFVRTSIDGEDRVVLDPNLWSADGATALAEWKPSADGRYLAYAIQEGGTDWRTIRILDVESGATLLDEIKWARFTNIAWTKDGAGFFYSRNPEPQGDLAFTAQALGHAVYFHQLGKPQAEDRLVYTAETDVPLLHSAEVTADGNYALIYSSALAGGNSVMSVDLTKPGWPVRAVVDSFDQAWALAGSIGTRLFLATQYGAERGRVVTVDISEGAPAITELIAEDPTKVLGSATLVGDRLIATYFHDAQTEVMRFTLEGTPDGRIALPGIGSASPFHGVAGDNEAFFLFTSHNTPYSIYRYDLATDTRSVWASPTVPGNLDAITVEQRFYASKDGTQVPIFIVRRDDVSGPAPTILNGYGGFGIPMVPFYSPGAIVWVEQGGVYAVANIRGGGEYGRAWHDAGRRFDKQNSFDDFIAAGEFLKAIGVTSERGLAIEGTSNGGLLIGAVVNQRPDLFEAAIADVGVHDMLRFDRFTGGHFWTQEFGSPTVEAEFRNLLAYSPLHNIRSGAPYPAILITTADTDDRVVPAHSFKYAATLQATDIGDRPHLLRVDTRAGHGVGKPTDKVIEELADMWAFAAHWTGLDVSLAD
jgi:prolyl oligopeptidase